VLRTLAEKRQFDDTLRAEMHAALKEFGEQYANARKGAAA
jgi:hypothetical protein